MKYRHFALVLGVLVVFSTNVDAQRYDFNGDPKDPFSIFGANDHLNYVDIDRNTDIPVTTWSVTNDQTGSMIILSASHNHPSAATSVSLVGVDGSSVNAEVFRQDNVFTIDYNSSMRIGRYVIRIESESGVEFIRVYVR
ncbi:MAG: hypothetical protein ACI959_000080 [Limisphaerales bacterium]|jgi:hypothetical protein